MKNEDLKQQIRNINDFTDIRTVRKIKDRINWLNIYDPETQVIVDLAKKKNI